MKKSKYFILIFIAATCCLAVGCAPAPTQKLAKPTLGIEWRTLKWAPVEHAVGYVVACENMEYEVTECEFDLSEYTQPTTYQIEVMALGDGVKFLDSEWAQISYKPMQATAIREGYDENGLRYTLLEDLSGYSVFAPNNAIKESMVIPDFFNGLPVKTIGSSAFAVKSNGIIEMRDPRGSLCNDVTKEIILPTYLEEIRPQAFECLRALKSITIPSGVTKIGRNAFYGCGSLRSIEIPDKVKTIEQATFMDCSLEEVKLPDELEEIVAGAFECTTFPYPVFMQKFTEITVPDTVKRIGNCAFMNCENLKTIKLPQTLEYISRTAFYKTAWYNEYPNELVTYDNILFGYKGNWYGGHNDPDPPPIKTFTVPDNITIIAADALSHMSELESVVIHDGVTAIGDNVFSGDAKLTYVKLPTGLMTIPEDAFEYCTSLADLEIPNTVTSIERSAFIHTAIKHMDIPESVTDIGRAAFGICENLLSITVPDRISTISDYLFSRCSALEEISLPESLISIGECAFQNCSALTEIILPESLTEIADYAFVKCSALKQIELPHSLISLGYSPFSDCASLEKIYYDGTEAEWIELYEKNNHGDPYKPFADAEMVFMRK